MTHVRYKDRHVLVDDKAETAICDTCKAEYNWHGLFKMVSVEGVLHSDCPNCHNLLVQAPEPTPGHSDLADWGAF